MLWMVEVVTETGTWYTVEADSESEAICAVFEEREERIVEVEGPQ